MFERAEDVESRYGDRLRIIDTRENAERNKFVVAAIRCDKIDDPGAA